jgi:hypothetical protein
MLQLLTDCHTLGAYYVEHTMTLSIINSCILYQALISLPTFPPLRKEGGQLTYEITMLCVWCAP